MSNAAQRILTAIVGGPVLVAIAYLGGWPFGLLVAAVSLVAQHELYGLMEAGGLRPFKAAGLALGGVIALRSVLPPAAGVYPILVVLVLLLVVLSPFVGREGLSPGSLAATVFGAIYPTYLLSFFTDVRLAKGANVGNDEAFFLTLSILLLVWITDTMAYYAGRAFGQHALAPAISPKKTWEGTIGGALGAVGVAAVLKVTLVAFLSWPDVVVLAVLCGVVSQLGDLAESKMKRAVGVKDSGTLLPGHGGLLDRFDGMIVSVPLVYLYLRYVAGIVL